MQQAKTRPSQSESASSLKEGRSGFILVRLTSEATHTEETDLRALAEKFGLRGLAAFLGRHDQIGTHPVVQSVSAKELLELEREARTSELPPLHSLTQYWRLDCRMLVQQLDILLDELRNLPEVELAHAELQAHDPLVNAADDPFAGSQNYLDVAPTGIDARWAWTQNRDGAGVAFIDLEQGWITNHEDLTAKAPTLIFGDNRNGVGAYHADHGTAVLGEVVAVDNAVGVVGVATGVTSVRLVSHWDTATGTALHVASAIVAAIAALSAGDVLLLEVARGGGAYLPTETNPADFDAIRLAVAHGIVVVEAGGNGGYNLDTYPTAATSTLNRGNANFADSGAIIVGAASSTVPHNRMSFSCYGSRIDCYGWGENVTSTGYGDLTAAGTPDTRQYTGIFNGTSSASPIVAGAALIVQGAYKATAGTPLAPLELRAILSDPANGTSQGTGTSGNIGVMPNLRQILSNALGVLPDIYLRDAVGDTGVIPSTGMLSVSPDIICTPAAVADADASFGEGSGTENVDTLGSRVEHGQDNFIYVRMKNRGAGAANGVTATVYWSEVATLVTPNMWNLIGTTAAVNVAQGNTLVVAGPLVWPQAQLPALGDHACFVAILNQAEDPAPPPLPATDWANFTAYIRDNNNIAWRNFDVVDVVADPSADPAIVPFAVVGAPDNQRVFDLLLLRDLPEGVEIWWEVPLGLYGLMHRAGFPKVSLRKRDQTARILLPDVRKFVIRDVQLGSKAHFPTRLIVRGSKAMKDHLYRVAISQRTTGQEVGRVTVGMRGTVKRRRSTDTQRSRSR